MQKLATTATFRLTSDEKKLVQRVAEKLHRTESDALRIITVSAARAALDLFEQGDSTRHERREQPDVRA